MDIKQEVVGNKGAFFIEENGKRLAEMTFSKAGDHLLIIDHTEVSDALRGKNVGNQLVAAAVEFVRKNRKNNMKILPLCPFAKSVFERVKEFQDVLHG